MKNNFRFILTVFLGLLGLMLSTYGQVATGGNYTLEKTVISNGGGAVNDSSGVFYKVESTIGQNAAGTKMIGGDYTQEGGFWTPEGFAPTAANATITGKVISAENRHIRNAFVTLTGGMLTTPRTVHTNQFGYFRFNDIEVGFFYILTVHHKQYSFRQNTLSLTLFENVSDVVFQADKVKKARQANDEEF